jgi:hypothetical protein
VLLDRLTARVGTRDVRVVAVDRGGSTVVVVRPARFPNAPAWLDWLPQPPARRATLRSEAALAPGITTRFLWPYPAPARGGSRPADVFPTSGARATAGAGLRWLFGTASGDDLAGPAHFADAVALAGAQAQASGTRAAVLLLLDDQAQDPSRFRPAEVRAYLERLRVPLFVWTVPEKRPTPLAPAWQPVREISGPLGLKNARQALLDELDAQVVVWVDGAEIPGHVEVVDGGTVTRSGVGILRNR